MIRFGNFYIPDALAEKSHHFLASEPTMGGISGGRTSGLMHVLSLYANQGNNCYFGCFANTGKEHEETLIFLRRMDEATGRPLAWVEFRQPTRLGEAPKHATFARVDFESASRSGEPFVYFLETLAAYRREVKDAPPAVPGFNMRLCTSYMKIKTKARWANVMFGGQYTDAVGLRADEPARVKRLHGAARGAVDFSTPLASAGITKADVLAFWRMQDFDLQIPEHLGNCTKCYLKDEADIAQSYFEEPDDGDWWLGIQDRYGDFRRGRTSMRTIFSEATTRMTVIRPAVRAGQEPERPADFDPHRWKLLVRQEKKRAVDGPAPFSCACETAQLGTDDED